VLGLICSPGPIIIPAAHLIDTEKARAPTPGKTSDRDRRRTLRSVSHATPLHTPTVFDHTLIAIAAAANHSLNHPRSTTAQEPCLQTRRAAAPRHQQQQATNRETPRFLKPTHSLGEETSSASPTTLVTQALAVHGDAARRCRNPVSRPSRRRERHAQRAWAGSDSADLS
jgi:hypothetical protein